VRGGKAKLEKRKGPNACHSERSEESMQFEGPQATAGILRFAQNDRREDAGELRIPIFQFLFSNFYLPVSIFDFRISM
jgi:hypothetical protein